MKILTLLVVCVLLSGCGAGYMKIKRDKVTGLVTDIEAKNFKGSVKTDKEEIKADSKADYKLLDINLNKMAT